MGFVKNKNNKMSDLEFKHADKTIYACPISSVLTNGDKSPTFPLHCSVQQGCFTSPFCCRPGAPCSKIKKSGCTKTLISLHTGDLLFLKNSENLSPSHPRSNQLYPTILSTRQKRTLCPSLTHMPQVTDKVFHSK